MDLSWLDKFFPGMDTIPVLAAQPEWAYSIAVGKKLIEIRRNFTQKRGNILMYASRTVPTEEKVQSMKECLPGINCVADLPIGKLIAVVNLNDCTEMRSQEEFDEAYKLHYNPSDNYIAGRTFNWHVNNAYMIDPIPFKYPIGAITWLKLSREKLLEIVNSVT